MARNVNITIILSLVLIPFAVMGQNVHYGHFHALILAVMVFCAFAVPNTWLRSFLLYATGWVAWLMVNLFIGRYATTTNMSLVLIDGSFYLLLGAAFFIAVCYSDMKDETLFNAICIIAIIQAVLAILQFFGVNPFFDFVRRFVKVTSELPATAAIGTLGNNNFLAAFCAISLPFFFRGKWFYGVPVIALSLIFAQTTTAFVAAAVGAGYFFYPRIRFKKTVLGALAGAGLLYAFIWHPFLNNPRFEYWLDGIRQITGSWASIIFGFGPTSKWRSGDELHNVYLMVWWSYGIIGLGILIRYILTVARENRLLFSAFIIACIDAIGNHGVAYTVPTAMLTITIMALIERGHEQRV